MQMSSTMNPPTPHPPGHQLPARGDDYTHSAPHPPNSLHPINTSPSILHSTTSATSKPRSAIRNPISKSKLAHAARLYDNDLSAPRAPPSPTTLLPPTPTASTLSTTPSTSLPTGAVIAFPPLSGVQASHLGRDPTTAETSTAAITTTYTGTPHKPPRYWSTLSPSAKAKAALIRYLGSCTDCRRRRVSCPLSHHDISALDKWLTGEGVEGGEREMQLPTPTSEGGERAATWIEAEHMAEGHGKRSTTEVTLDDHEYREGTRSKAREEMLLGVGEGVYDKYIDSDVLLRPSGDKAAIERFEREMFGEGPWVGLDIGNSTAWSMYRNGSTHSPDPDQPSASRTTIEPLISNLVSTPTCPPPTHPAHPPTIHPDPFILGARFPSARHYPHSYPPFANAHTNRRPMWRCNVATTCDEVSDCVSGLDDHFERAHFRVAAQGVDGGVVVGNFPTDPTTGVDLSNAPTGNPGLVASGTVHAAEGLAGSATVNAMENASESRAGSVDDCCTGSWVIPIEEDYAVMDLHYGVGPNGRRWFD